MASVVAFSVSQIVNGPMFPAFSNKTQVNSIYCYFSLQKSMFMKIYHDFTSKIYIGQNGRNSKSPQYILCISWQ